MRVCVGWGGEGGGGQRREGGTSQGLHNSSTARGQITTEGWGTSGPHTVGRLSSCSVTPGLNPHCLMSSENAGGVPERELHWTWGVQMEGGGEESV